MAFKATPPTSAPPAIPFLAQAAEDLPKLKEQERMAALRVDCWRRNLDAAERALLDLRGKIARKEANMAVAMARLQKEEEATKAKAKEKAQVVASEDPQRPRPTKARRLE